MIQINRSTLNRIKRVSSNPKLILLYILSKVKYLFADKMYLKTLYFLSMNKRLNLDNPVSYNEKLQWLKLYYHNPVHTIMVDKLQVKEYVSKTIGDEYVIPLLGHWDKFEEIDFNYLPNKFVLKTTHGCGGIIICKDKTKLNFSQVKKVIEKSLKQNYFVHGREWPYKNVAPKIIAEKFMVDESGYELKDYKFFCFNGEPKALFVATDRESDTRFDFFDLEFNCLPFENGHKKAEKVIHKPKKYDKMIELAKKLSQGIPHVRVDLYNINGEIFFGEMTFFHWGGIVPFEPEEWDYTFGSWLTLPDKML